jgi:LysM repeat protein
MELPKNVTQVGECDRNCRIYVEDYVMSYLKQCNKEAQDGPIAAALYGVRRQEADLVCLFFYGACRLSLLKRAGRQLAQTQLQEIEVLRQQHFSEYEFLGYRILDGEMVEGFYVYEQGISRYINGYAQFYEKNDSMLNFMLEERQEAKPEEFHPEKYRVAEKNRGTEKNRRTEKRRTAEKNRDAEKSIGGKSGHAVFPKQVAAAALVICCAAGIVFRGGSQAGGALKETAARIMEELQKQQLPDAMSASASGVVVGTIVTEDKLTEAIQKENSQPDKETQDAETAIETEETEAQTEDQAAQQEEDVTQEQKEQTGETAEAEGQAVQTSSGQDKVQTQETDQPVTYTIRKGDTLTGICMARYGSDQKVSEICALNDITNPNDIKTGQKILLP